MLQGDEAFSLSHKKTLKKPNELEAKPAAQKISEFAHLSMNAADENKHSREKKGAYIDNSGENLSTLSQSPPLVLATLDSEMSQKNLTTVPDFISQQKNGWKIHHKKSITQE